MPTGNSNYNGALQAATAEYWANGKFANAVFDGVPFIKWLRSGGREKVYDGGKLILEPVMFDTNGTIQSQTPFQEVNNTPQDGMTDAQFTPAMYTGTAVMSWLDQAQNSGTAKMIDVWEAKVEQMKLAFQVQLNTDSFLDGTQAPYALTGLAAIVGSTGTYGNISRTNNTFWQSYVEATAGVLSEDDIRTGYYTVGRLNTYPDAMWTTQTLYQKYESLIVPALRFTPGDKGDLGVPSLSYHGTPIYYDNQCQSGVFYFLTSQYLKFRPLKGWNMEITDRRQPTRQLVDMVIAYFAGQITCSNCRYQGKLTGRTAA